MLLGHTEEGFARALECLELTSGDPELEHERLSRFVYYQTQDLMRGVSEHVSIGRASRNGEEMSAWFILCREGK